MSALDSWIAASLLPLAVWILISGLDDLFVDLVRLWLWLRQDGVPPPSPGDLDGAKEKRTAIFVPLWREAAVIGGMLEHNVAAIRYGAYDFFVGVYPNDEATMDVVREAESRWRWVHMVLCPHDGPTSKADNLNWIYQRMLLHEETHGVHFDVIVVHDAEDLIHPEELRWINHYTTRYGMVQIPVLPLKTPFFNFTHGLYCDEFAEFHGKDMPVRQALDGFIPSSGVGTGYARWALEQVADAASNRVFESSCLTEDYEIGIRLRRLGCPQLFVPLDWLRGEPVATRELFPLNFRQALRQRTRWVTGISLQSWERHGWSGGAKQIYWLWRDRKGLIGNPVTLAANAILAYGVATGIWSHFSGQPWGLGPAGTAAANAPALYATLFLLALRLSVRYGCCARIYGWAFALGVPFRVLLGNGLNFLATAMALVTYTGARLRHRPLVWFKTEHIYPSRAALVGRKRLLGEVLVRTGSLSEVELADALASKPTGPRLGEYLLEREMLTERELYEALSLQQNVTFGEIQSPEVPVWVARTLPADVARRWKVLPYKVDAGRLYVAGPELPSDEMQRDLRRFTRLRLEFEFITPSNLEALMRELLGCEADKAAP